MSVWRYRSNKLQLPSQYTKFKKGTPAIASKGNKHLSPCRSQSKGPTLLLESAVQDSLGPVSVPSQMMSSCSVLATPSCSVGQEGWLGGGCPTLLLRDLVHILTHFLKPASLCAAKTLLLGFNLPLPLTKTKGMKLETNPEVRIEPFASWFLRYFSAYWGSSFSWEESSLEKQVLILSSPLEWDK